jgi:hypothetical protein
MTARPVPPSSSPLVLALGRVSLAQAVPCPASPPGRPDIVYGFGRIDASDRVTIAALG